MDRAALWVHAVAKSWTRLSDLHFLGFLIAQLVKNLPVIQENPVQFLGCEEPLEKG